MAAQLDAKVITLSIRNASGAIDRIVSSNASLQRLAQGFRWAEGPIWVPQDKSLVFSDVSGNTMYRWSPQAGMLHRPSLATFRQPSGYANGNTLDTQGRLVSCEHVNRRVSRTERDGNVVTLCSHYHGKRLNSPNDIVVKSDGFIYFTDPPDGLTPEWGAPGDRDIDFQGVYRYSPESGELVAEVTDFQTPNGLAFSPDEKRLYIDDTDRQHIRAFDVLPDGSLANGRVFAEFDTNLGPGWPDGMKTDIEGNLYATGPAGVWIIDPSGATLGIIETPETATNMNWGGPELKDLYITTASEKFDGSAVYRVQLNIRGHV